MSISRRRLLRDLGIAGAGIGAAALTPGLMRTASAVGDGPRFLIVIGCFGLFLRIGNLKILETLLIMCCQGSSGDLQNSNLAHS